MACIRGKGLLGGQLKCAWHGNKKGKEQLLRTAGEEGDEGSADRCDSLLPPSPAAPEGGAEVAAGGGGPPQTRRPPARAVDAPVLLVRLPVPPFCVRCCCCLLVWARRWFRRQALAWRRASAAPDSSPTCRSAAGQEGSVSARAGEERRPHRRCSGAACSAARAACPGSCFAPHDPSRHAPKTHTHTHTIHAHTASQPHPRSPSASGLPAGGRRAPGWDGWRCAAGRS